MLLWGVEIMSREIKFRDYELTKNEMRYFDLDSYDRQEHNSYGNVMQFTGLKDKNGVEIFEGDIVSYSTEYYGVLKTGKVQTVKWIEDMEHDGFGQPMATGFLLYGFDWVVIGNLFKNPELLEDSK